MTEIIIRNSVRCEDCGDEIESVHRHDFRICSCGRVAVDGGKDYLRRAWRKDARWTETSIVDKGDKGEEKHLDGDKG